jgi:hypothetical protein
VLGDVQVVSWDITEDPVSINGVLIKCEIVGVISVKTSDEWDNKISSGCVNSCDCGLIGVWVNTLNIGCNSSVGERINGEDSSNILLLIKEYSSIFIYSVIEAIEWISSKIYILSEVTNNQVWVTKKLLADSDAHQNSWEACGVWNLGFSSCLVAFTIGCSDVLCNVWLGVLEPVSNVVVQ